MAAALVEGIRFYQQKNGTWFPSGSVAGDHNTQRAIQVFNAVARALGYATTSAYLYASSRKKAEVRERLRLLVRAEETSP